MGVALSEESKNKAVFTQSPTYVNPNLYYFTTDSKRKYVIVGNNRKSCKFVSVSIYNACVRALQCCTDDKILSNFILLNTEINPQLSLTLKPSIRNLYDIAFTLAKDRGSRVTKYSCNNAPACTAIGLYVDMIFTTAISNL